MGAEKSPVGVQGRKASKVSFELSLKNEWGLTRARMSVGVEWNVQALGTRTLTDLESGNNEPVLGKPECGRAYTLISHHC